SSYRTDPPEGGWQASPGERLRQWGGGAISAQPIRLVIGWATQNPDVLGTWPDTMAAKRQQPSQRPVVSDTRSVVESLRPSQEALMVHVAVLSSTVKLKVAWPEASVTA